MITSWYNSSKAIDLYADFIGGQPKSLNHPTIRSRRMYLLTYFTFMYINARMVFYKPWKSLYKNFLVRKNKLEL